MTEIKAEGVKKSILEELAALVGYTMEDQVLLDEKILEVLSRITGQLNREIMVMTNDKNTIEHIGIGDAASVKLEDTGMMRNKIGLNRIRAIHTHPNGVPYLSAEDFSAAENLRLQCMVAVGVLDNRPAKIGIGVPVVEEDGTVYHQGVFESLEKLNAFPLDDYVYAANRQIRKDPSAGFDIEDTEERALLIGVEAGNNRSGIDLEDSMKELERLVETAGGTVCEQVTQSRPQIDPVFYVGRGKLLELVRLVQNFDINLIVANDELGANQIACIEAFTGCKTIDRTTIILDIFAKQAKTREGKLQVELAQQKYRLSRLKGLGIVLSRTGGGIGTRGPGEKKLETDRRHIRRQIDELERKNARIDKTNALNAIKRKKNNIRTVSLVGYTNSGKSTLFNCLTNSDAVIKDGLFITLDSTMRKVNPEEGDYLVSDTVGFIEKLPHELIKAFKTTLKEVETADLLLHVVDASNKEAGNQMNVVAEVLRDIGSGTKKVLTVYNKMDKLTEAEQLFFKNKAEREDGVCISAASGEGIEALNQKIHGIIGGMVEERDYCIPYDEAKVLALLHQKAKVLSLEYGEAGTLVKAEINDDFPVHQFEKYAVEGGDKG